MEYAHAGVPAGIPLVLPANAVEVRVTVILLAAIGLLSLVAGTSS